MAHLEHYNTTNDIKDAERQYAVLLTHACFLDVIRVDASYRQVVALGNEDYSGYARAPWCI